MAKEYVVKLRVDAKDAKQTVDELGHGLSNVDDNAAKTKHGFTIMRQGIIGVGVAFKALGIGLIISALVGLKEALGRNQVVMDKLNIAAETINAVFQKLITSAIDVGNKLTSAFTDPQQAVKDLWITIKQNFVDRIEGLIDAAGALGKVLKGVWSTDLAMIKEGAAEAKTGLIQLATGMTEVEQTGFVETLKTTVVELKNTVTESNEYATSLVKLRNEVKLAEANQRQLQLTYQKDAEIQRQIRDNVNLTFEERIEANNRLGEILEEQFEKEKALAEKKIALAEMELSLDKNNIDLQVQLINAQTDLADLEERITGQKSEQLVNLIALQNEYNESLKDTGEQSQKSGETDVEATKKAQEEKQSIIRGALGGISSLIDKESKKGKKVAKALAIIDTFAAANKALSQGGILGIAAAAGIVAQGIANVKAITDQKLPGGDNGGGGTPSVPAADLGAGGIGGLIPNMESVELPDGAPQPVQAYVVENDISDAQALQEELEIQATL